MFSPVTGSCEGWGVFRVFRLTRTVGKTGSQALLGGRCGATRLRLRLLCAACCEEAASLACGLVPRRTERTSRSYELSCFREPEGPSTVHVLEASFATRFVCLVSIWILAKIAYSK